MDLLTHLSDEHERLRAHLVRIQAAAEAHDDEMVRAALDAARTMLTDGLDAHIALEEAEAFAAIGKALGNEDLLEPFREEHVEVRLRRDELFAAVDHGEVPHGSALALCELILDHQQREDLVLFPSARVAAPPSR